MPEEDVRILDFFGSQSIVFVFASYLFKDPQRGQTISVFPSVFANSFPHDTHRMSIFRIHVTVLSIKKGARPKGQTLLDNTIYSNPSLNMSEINEGVNTFSEVF